MKRFGVVAAIIGFALTLPTAQAHAAELKLLEGNALNAVMDELGPQFEKATGTKIVATIGTSGATQSPESTAMKRSTPLS